MSYKQNHFIVHICKAWYSGVGVKAHLFLVWMPNDFSILRFALCEWMLCGRDTYDYMSCKQQHTSMAFCAGTGVRAQMSLILISLIIFSILSCAMCQNNVCSLWWGEEVWKIHSVMTKLLQLLCQDILGLSELHKHTTGYRNESGLSPGFPGKIDLACSSICFILIFDVTQYWYNCFLQWESACKWKSG